MPYCGDHDETLSVIITEMPESERAAYEGLHKLSSARRTSLHGPGLTRRLPLESS